MLKVENAETWGWEGAIRGMRNPKNSWEKSDSRYENGNYIIGKNDLKLMATLAKAGNDHGKFLRMIHVQCDVIAPLYWWKEADQYKVGTTTDSCSTMHKIQSKPITLDDFSIDNYEGLGRYKDAFNSVVDDCEELRQAFVNTGDKFYWRMLIQLLPASYNQKRTWDLNYAVLKNIYWARRNHKLSEWHTLCEWIETLPHFKELILGE